MSLTAVAKLIASIAVSFVAGGLGSLATIPNIPSWYAGLDKPPLLPPNEVFGPVWSILYTLMGIALFLVWNRTSKESAHKAYYAFGLQIILNTVWSVVFFGLHLPWLGLIIIVGLIASIIWTMVEFKKHSVVALWLLAPYLVWVCFATYLTTGVAFLN
jgi:tryptophan-rich sensory protein